MSGRVKRNRARRAAHFRNIARSRAGGKFLPAHLNPPLKRDRHSAFPNDRCGIGYDYVTPLGRRGLRQLRGGKIWRGQRRRLL